MRIRGRSDDGQVVKWSGERQMNVKSQSELDIGGRETCLDCVHRDVSAFVSADKDSAQGE